MSARVGGVVRVRSPEIDRLDEVLKHEGLLTTRSNDHALVVQGTTRERVGDIAFTSSVPMHELATEGSCMEEIFLELTSEQVQ